jgi:hypothetical protein
VRGINDGPCITTYYDGSETYKGLYLNGLRHGPCEVSYADGSFFKGFYAERFITGLGVYQRSDGMAFRGNWEEDKIR